MDHTTYTSLIHDLCQAVNAHDGDRAAQFFADDYEGLDVSRASRQRGRSAARAALNDWLRAFPDLQLTTREVLVLPEQVVLYWTQEGTHKGLFMNVPPTGQKVEVCGFSLLTVHEGKIKRGLHLWDMAGLLRAMRLLPELPDVSAATSQIVLLTSFLQAR